MIVITGATGQLGSLIVASLLERIPAEEVGVSVRDPGRAADLAERGVRVRRGDFSEPASPDPGDLSRRLGLVPSSPPAWRGLARVARLI